MIMFSSAILELKYIVPLCSLNGMEQNSEIHGLRQVGMTDIYLDASFSNLASYIREI